MIGRITGEMIKNDGEIVIDRIWKLCNKTFVEREWFRRTREVIELFYILKDEKMSYRTCS